MPRTKPGTLPKLRHHKHTGRAVVTIQGRHIYLGRWGSPEAEAEYGRVIAEWRATGAVPMPRSQPSVTSNLVSELTNAYRVHARRSLSDRTYAKCVTPAVDRLDATCGHLFVDQFSPRDLKAFQQRLLDEPAGTRGALSRPYVNRLVSRVRSVFKWGVSEGLAPVEVWQGLTAVEGLRRGRCAAKDPEPVRPVSEDQIEETLPHLPPVVRDMVLLQRASGMRPGELCTVTMRQINFEEGLWVYRPTHHKTAHHGKSREVFLGPRCQEILRPYLRSELDLPLFSPAESEQRRRGGSQAPARARSAYGPVTYARAIRRACERAGVDHWTPNRLRHARATELRAAFGLDTAGAVLGHTRLETTQIYAEQARTRAVEAALRSG